MLGFHESQNQNYPTTNYLLWFSLFAMYSCYHASQNCRRMLLAHVPKREQLEKIMVAQANATPVIGAPQHIGGLISCEGHCAEYTWFCVKKHPLSAINPQESAFPPSCFQLQCLGTCVLEHKKCSACLWASLELFIRNECSYKPPAVDEPCTRSTI